MNLELSVIYCETTQLCDSKTKTLFGYDVLQCHRYSITPKKKSVKHKPLIKKQIRFYKYSLRVSINKVILKGSYYEIFNKNFQSCTVHLDTIESFIYPTDAQLNCSKRMLKFTCEVLLHVSVFHIHYQGATICALLKLYLLIIGYNMSFTESVRSSGCIFIQRINMQPLDRTDSVNDVL